ncbi:MAG: hypothetical protein JW940_05730, partial [Polyangiaceae bacterium]|nr:hypothetical protein [Polyangiaceae bacterium]
DISAGAAGLDAAAGATAGTEAGGATGGRQPDISAGAAGLDGGAAAAGGAVAPNEADGAAGATRLPASAGGGSNRCTPAEISCDVTPWHRIDEKGGMQIGDIYYEFGGQWSADDKALLFGAMSLWESMTDPIFHFREDPEHPQRVRFRHSEEPRCGAEPGMPEGVRDVDAWSGHCTSLEQLRVLGSIIGLPFQHQRVDRDRYVVLESLPLCGAAPGRGKHPDTADLNKCGGGNAARLGPYDLNSVMAYAEPYPENCGGDALPCWIRGREGGLPPQPTTLTLRDAAAAIELHTNFQLHFSSFTPIVSSDSGDRESLDLDLSAGVSMRGAPALSFQAEDVMDAFALGEDGHIYHKRYAQGWEPGYWLDLGGDFAPATDKVVASASSELGIVDVVARSEDGSLRHRRCEGGDEQVPCQWGDAWSEPLAPPGKEETSGPALVAASGDRLDLFVRCGDALYQRTRLGGTWSGWKSFVGPIAATPAAAAMDGIAHVVAATDQGGLVAKSGDVAALPSDWIVVDSLPILAPGTSPALGFDGAVVDIYYQTLSGMLGHKAALATDPSAPDWKPNGGVLGGVLEGSPAIVRWPAEHDSLHVLHIVAHIAGSGPWHRSWPEP